MGRKQTLEIDPIPTVVIKGPVNKENIYLDLNAGCGYVRH